MTLPLTSLPPALASYDVALAAAGARPELLGWVAPGVVATPRQILIRSTLALGEAAAALVAARHDGAIELVQGEVPSR